MDAKMLTFRVKRPGEEKMVPPRWRKVEVENADCPECKEKMIVIIGHKGILYGFCPKCRNYFIGE
jgi:ssDNA-binding Zn-finger/Zn-ribbon topoisomerase 1